MAKNFPTDGGYSLIWAFSSFGPFGQFFRFNLGPNRGNLGKNADSVGQRQFGTPDQGTGSISQYSGAGQNFPIFVAPQDIYTGGPFSPTWVVPFPQLVSDFSPFGETTMRHTGSAPVKKDCQHS